MDFVCRSPFRAQVTPRSAAPDDLLELPEYSYSTLLSAMRIRRALGTGFVRGLSARAAAQRRPAMSAGALRTLAPLVVDAALSSRFASPDHGPEPLGVVARLASPPQLAVPRLSETSLIDLKTSRARVPSWAALIAHMSSTTSLAQVAASCLRLLFSRPSVGWHCACGALG